MSQTMQSIADWMIFHKPLYMGRVIRTHTRSGVSFIVEEANEAQSRKWFAFNFVDETGSFDGIDKFTHRILVGRHKLLSKHNQLKYAEDFYASLNNHKIKELLGPEFASLGGQWIQITGVENIGTTYAWLVLSPWGKVWMSRLAILCLAVSTTDNFTTSDILDQSAISFKDLPQPMQILASSSLHNNRHGESIMNDNYNNLPRRFKSDPLDAEVQSNFKNLYGLDRYAAVRGDSLWDPELIGKTLGRTALTGVLTMATGNGYWGFIAAAGNQLYERQSYLNAGIPDKIKQQCQDLYDQALNITQIASNLHDTNLVYIATKLREATDDFRRTIPGRFQGQEYAPQSFYRGPNEQIRNQYRKLFAQTEVKPENKGMIGIAQEDDTSPIDIGRLPETAALGIRSYMNRNPRNPKSWLAGAVPLVSSQIEKYWATHSPMGPASAMEGSIKNMREILGEIRVLTKEYDHKNSQQLYPEIQTATNVIHSFLKRIETNMPQSQNEPATSNNLTDMTGTNQVYPSS